MNWGKFILLFQAVITLVIGIVFLLQMIQIEKYKAEQMQENQIAQMQNDYDVTQLPQFKEIENIGFRFNTAGYILFVISAIEIILIMRLMD